jgi:hypothetical protein
VPQLAGDEGEPVPMLAEQGVTDRTDLADPVRRYQVYPGEYYFRTNPLFETGAEQYAWLNDIVCS